ncbi:MAG: 2'-deoxycytidine 5'-triphosphate deaminase, partial [Pseudomonadota bacterium]
MAAETIPGLGTGVLPSQSLAKLIDAGLISGTPQVEPAQIQPASLDLRLGTTAYRVRASFLPGKDRTVAERLDDFSMHSIDLSGGAVLERGCVYLVPLMERLDLSDDISAVANAKSSTGRLDLFTRLITDHGTEFDRIDPGYTGPLYAEVSPRSFSVLAQPGARLNQIRFRRGQSLLSDEDLRARHTREKLVDGPAHIDGGLGFSVDLDRGADTIVGYRAKPHTGLIDLARLNHYPVDAFWEEVRAPERHIILDPGAFYILVSREA